MGMSIDEAIHIIEHHKLNDVNNAYELGEAFCMAIDTMRKYQKFQDQSLSLYMERLKADMVAMLTEIQLEIEECVDGAEGSPQFEQGVDIARGQVVDIIQQKISLCGKVRRCKGGVVIERDGWCHAYPDDWWNAECEEPGKDKSDDK